MSDLTTSFHAFAQPLKSKVTQLTEKSLLYQHYPTLKKATNSELGDTPGYVYEELVQLTYSDLTMATQLAIYLADCLGTIHILLKHLTEAGAYPQLPTQPKFFLSFSNLDSNLIWSF